MSIIVYLVLGACAGLIAGLFGLGGGVIIVPVLIFAFGLLKFPADVLVHLAVGTSLATIIITSSSSVLAHHKRRAISWPVVKQMSIGIIIGTWLGAFAADYISGPALQKLIGVFSLCVALQMALNLKPSAARKLPNKWGQSVAGTIIGSISSLFGIGGGSLSVPFLSYCSVAMPNAVATSSALSLPIAISGTLGHIYSGWNSTQLPEYSLGYLYLPAWLGIILTSALFAKLGAKLAHQLPPIVMKRLFATILTLVAIKFLFFS
ncbi:sulfite exporter TauE/SafE family protein [Motilimonas cestriensis]|uniref:Probable membrane transporter protein n=1 Tax=Motilimonas cestriensis TaxID=2742685 RepID=A0ABS8WBG1_9GAMM|nr:sulfite exporter TauE/SafE family protein [Motilimonas cestriensis]MCE2596347.1 sulfite exporter TauE/SafE family protein [Motilimonas cestriensis]